jgi:hypothetical protein
VQTDETRYKRLNRGQKNICTRLKHGCCSAGLLYEVGGGESKREHVKAACIVARCLGDGSVQNRYELGLACPKIVYSCLQCLLGGGGPYQQIKVYSRGQELKWNRIEHRQHGIGPLMHQIYVIPVKKTQQEVTQ